MAANSKHYADVLAWLQRVIDSCKTPEQVNSTRKMVLLFHTMYNPQNEYNFIFKNKVDLLRIINQKIKDYGTTSK